MRTQLSWQPFQDISIQQRVGLSLTGWPDNDLWVARVTLFPWELSGQGGGGNCLGPPEV